MAERNKENQKEIFSFSIRDQTENSVLRLAIRANDRLFPLPWEYCGGVWIRFSKCCCCNKKQSKPVFWDHLSSFLLPFGLPERQSSRIRSSSLFYRPSCFFLLWPSFLYSPRARLCSPNGRTRRKRPFREQWHSKLIFLHKCRRCGDWFFYLFRYEPIGL